MPRLLPFFCCLIVSAAPVIGGERASPYKAYVTTDNVEVRSGPAGDFYPTDKLQKGEMVEVYRRDAEGWCAIRPPEGSFSWISGRAVKLEEDNVASVVQDKAAARVGSRLSDVRDVVQVRLRKGEAVEILDSKELSDDRPQEWCKIAPPSGEFRWISEKYLSREKPREELGDAQSKDPASWQAASSDRSDTQPPVAERDAASSKEFQSELDRIDLELSMMVVEEPSSWSFDGMRIRVESMLEEMDSAVDRGKARLLLNKITRFDDIKQRYDSITAMRERNSASNRFLAGLQRTMEKASAMVDPETQFDGVGQLQQVFSPKLGAPRYALVDEAGNVRYYVTPAPGVSLQNYVGRQIGVTGTRGYMPEQRAQHITARHVSSLENRIR